MSRWRDEETRLKVLLLQLNADQRSFIIHIPGELTQKSKIGSDKIAAALQLQLREQAVRYRWRYVPRAKVAVTMHFTSVEPNSPSLHNLVKFYLDPFRQTIFGDDRQVHYLEASARVRKKDDIVPESSALIEVERLENLNRRLRLYNLLLRDSGFRDFLRHEHDGAHLLDDYEGEHRRDIELEVTGTLVREYELRKIWGKTLNPEEVEQLARLRARYQELMSKGRIQQQMLQSIRIGWFDSPNRPLLEGNLKAFDLEPLTINLGDLPLHGESRKYKSRIKESIKQFSAEETLFETIHVPIELDIQISSRTRSLEKDLDNTNQLER